MTLSFPLSGKTMVRVFSGYYGAFVSTTEPALYGIGYNVYGNLGSGSTSNTPQTSFVAVSGVSKTIVSLAANEYHTVAIASDGTYYAWGYDVFDTVRGPAALSSSSTFYTPSTGLVATNTAIFSSSDVSVLAPGLYSMGFVSTAGTAYTAGMNTNGVLGVASTNTLAINYALTAVDTTGVLSAKVISAIRTLDKSLVMTTESTNNVYGWGSNSNNCFGLNSPLSYYTSAVAIQTGSISGKKISDITLGLSHCVLLDSTGTVHTAGFSSQLGYTPQVSNFASITGGVLSGKTVTQVAAGAYHTVILTADYLVMSFGDNTYGQLGNGNYILQVTPVTVATLSSLIITKISSGSLHSCAIASTGALYCWGSSNFGENGLFVSTSTPTAITTLNTNGRMVSDVICAGQHTIVLGDDNTISAMGLSAGALLGDSTSAQYVSSVSAGGPVTVNKANMIIDAPIKLLGSGPWSTFIGTPSTATAGTCSGYNTYSRSSCGGHGKCYANNACACFPLLSYKMYLSQYFAASSFSGDYQDLDPSYTAPNMFVSVPNIPAPINTIESTDANVPLIVGYTISGMTHSPHGSDPDMATTYGITITGTQFYSVCNTGRQAGRNYTLSCFGLVYMSNGVTTLQNILRFRQYSVYTDDTTYAETWYPGLSSNSPTIETFLIQALTLRTESHDMPNVFCDQSADDQPPQSLLASNNPYSSTTYTLLPTEFAQHAITVPSSAPAVYHVMFTLSSIMHNTGGVISFCIAMSISSTLSTSCLSEGNVFLSDSADTTSITLHAVTPQLTAGSSYALGFYYKAYSGGGMTLGCNGNPDHILGFSNVAIRSDYGMNYVSQTFTPLVTLTGTATTWMKLPQDIYQTFYLPQGTTNVLFIIYISRAQSTQNNKAMYRLLVDGQEKKVVMPQKINLNGGSPYYTSVELITTVQSMTQGYHRMRVQYKITGTGTESWPVDGAAAQQARVILFYQPTSSSTVRGFFGPDCTVNTCYGKLSNGTTACTDPTHGTCFSYNNCICNSGWSGSECTSMQCFGIPSASSTACSSNGTCTGPDTCSCTSGHYGSQCEKWNCFGVYYNTTTTTCSGNGTCIAPDTCICKSHFYGQNCEAYNCYGIMYNASNVCSSNGTCLQYNTCSCNAGFYGTQCESWNCFGSIMTSSNGCSTNGSCVAPNTCSCKPGFYGTQCEAWSCYGTVYNSSSVCSGNGSCLAPNTCSCRSAYYSSQCEAFNCYGTIFNTSSVCSSNGTCIDIDNCRCNNGFYGSSCEAWNCYGAIFNSSGVCSSNGTCMQPDTCSCNPGFYGSHCDAWNCYGIIFNSSSTCSSNGTCISPNNCACNSGYYGQRCEAWNCYGIMFNKTSSCSTNGACVAPDTCSCNAGFYGQECDTWNCYGIKMNSSSVCSSNGTCASPDTCSCRSGYYGMNCDAWNCYGTIFNLSSVCSTNGSCIAPDTCLCRPEYYGSRCEAYKCYGIIYNSTNVCSKNGTCIAPDTCSCNAGFYGLQCDAWNCYNTIMNATTVCSSNGTCAAPNVCTCKTGFYGQQCEAWKCYGTVFNASSVCGSNGTCINADTCLCKPGYYGSRCDAYTCFGIVFNSSNACSTNGSCIALDTCSCNAGYYGQQCDAWKCYSIIMNSTSVCSTNGTCVSPNYCSCNAGFYGQKCEAWNCYGSIFNSTQTCYHSIQHYRDKYPVHYTNHEMNIPEDHFD
jgi:alpha-tubulin suppressor-like RCC1 family protein